MFKCKRCGEVFESDEVPTYRDDFGFDTEVGFCSYSETFIDRCPDCHGELEEAQQCEECDRWFCESDLELDDDCRYLCKKCFKKWEENQDDFDRGHTQSAGKAQEA